MVHGKVKIVTTWFNNMLVHYQEFTRQSGPHRCRVAGLHYSCEGKAALTVKISGIKGYSFINYFPEELVANDNMLQEFSQTDVRAITFYAIKNAALTDGSGKKETCSIAGQEFLNGKTVFLLKEQCSEGIIRKTAYELYSDKNVLQQFGFDDLINIVQAATQEKLIEEIME